MSHKISSSSIIARKGNFVVVERQTDDFEDTGEFFVCELDEERNQIRGIHKAPDGSILIAPPFHGMLTHVSKKQTKKCALKSLETAHRVTL